MDRLNDPDGKLISTDRATIVPRLLEYRQSVSKLPTNISKQTRADLASDLAFLSLVNRSIIDDNNTLSSSSASALSAADPLSCWRGQPLSETASNQPAFTVDQPPNALPSSISSQLDRISTTFSPSTSQAASSAFRNYQRQRQSHSAACSHLEADFTLSELSAVLSNSRDVGPGLDGVSPASLQSLHDDTKAIILDHLNHVWKTGVAPTSWNEIRIVLHYKGKGSDPYCADNYRGLGIGAIWEKLLSLMMMHRLEEFLLKTDALHGSQGGFLRMRGPPEQVFTLSESVRAELLRPDNNQSVFLTFIDIEKAYDSVLHPKLWARCAELGIGGRFLSTLQSMYARKKGTVDINGELIGSHDIECGVLQGNPLSPLLFNIYIDKLLRSIDDFAKRIGPSVGIPLPHLNSQIVGRLCSLFFADDGVLITRDHASTQLLLDFIDTELSRICLPLNARKTKVLIVPLLGTKPEPYGALKRDAAQLGGFVARGRAVEIVDEFSYLGVTLWWRWDFTRAYQCALSRAKRGLYRLRQAGFQNRHIPLVFQYRLASAHVLSHLDYVAPLAGVEGYSTAVKQNEQMLSSMLRVIARTHPMSSGQALKAESGTWQQVVRIRMLQFRFFLKLCCSPASSTHRRALAQSFQCLLRNPVSRASSAARTTFFGRVLKSAHLFQPDCSVPAGTTDSLLHLALFSVPTPSLVILERLEAGVWVRFRLGVDPSVDHPNQRLRLRCTSSRAFAMDYSTSSKITTWHLPVGTSLVGALTRWSLPLRLACFASLRRRGNRYRQELFSETSAAWCTLTSGLRDYAPLKRASYMEPYWFSLFPGHAQRLLRARTAQRWGNEYDLRRAECMVPLLVSPHVLENGRLHLRRSKLRSIQPCERACYLCAEDVWMPETMPHLLLHCQHQSVVELRVVVVTRLHHLAAQLASVEPSAPPAPDFSNDIALYCVLQLCTGVGSTHHREHAAPATDAYRLDVLRPMGGMCTRSQSASRDRVGLEQLRRQWFQLDPELMRPAVQWVAHLCNAWRTLVGNDQANSEAARAGQDLVHLVCKFNQDLFAARRRALSNDYHYWSRDRDPVAVQLHHVTASPPPEPLPGSSPSF
jgi:hypothetical protein